MTNKRKLQIACNKLWIEVALKKWGNVCTTCGRSANTLHHFVPKSLSLNLRYDVQNSIPMCTGIGSCHYKVHGFDPTETYRLNDIIVKKRGEEWHRYIEDNRRVKVKHNVMWLEAQEALLKEALLHQKLGC